LLGERPTHRDRTQCALDTRRRCSRLEDAAALEIYAKQAMNVEAERKATEIRLRAERRAGELMAKLERGDAGRPKKAGAVAAISHYRQTIERVGIPERTARHWQELAAVPKEQFEDALRDAHVARRTGRATRLWPAPGGRRASALGLMVPRAYHQFSCGAHRVPRL
jgi:hypothetical protein